jgi:hypothetical protein
VGEGQAHGVGAGANQGLGVIEAGAFDLHQHFARFKGRDLFDLNFNDLGAAGAEGAGDAAMSDRAHF